MFTKSDIKAGHAQKNVYTKADAGSSNSAEAYSTSWKRNAQTMTP